MRTTDEKYSTVIQKNTFYFFNNNFEDEYEKYIAQGYFARGEEQGRDRGTYAQGV